MSYTVKILIPIGLGIVAAILNLVVLNGRTKPVSFIKVNRDIKYGEPIEGSVLEELQLPAEFSHLKDTAVPFEDLGVLIAQPAQRDLTKGDIVFLRDIAIRGERIDLRSGETAFPLTLRDVEIPSVILQIGNELEFKVKPSGANNANAEPIWVGPFRLLSVGDKVSNDENSKTGSTSPTITVAFDSRATGKRQEHQKLLEQAADQLRGEDRMLLNVQLHKAG